MERSGFAAGSALPGHADEADTAVPLSEVMAQITRCKQQYLQEQRRERAEPATTPSWDRDLCGKAEPGSPARLAQLAPPNRQSPSPPRPRYNIRVDGRIPWLPGHYSGGKLLAPVPGYLPQKDLNHWDKTRATLPKRSWTTGRPAVEGRPQEVRAAELYDTRRAEAPDWKPTTWKHTGECFPLPDEPTMGGRRGSRGGSQAGTPKGAQARMLSQPGTRSLPSLPAAQPRAHGYPAHPAQYAAEHQSPQLSRGTSLPQVGPTFTGAAPTRSKGYAMLR